MKYNFDEVVDRRHTVSLKYDMRSRIFGKEDVIPMWVADMDFKTPDFVISALQKRLGHEILGYTYTPRSCYEALADWCLRRYKWNINTEWISFAPGVVPALNLLVMEFSKPGDNIIVQPPVYFPFFSAIKNHGRRLVLNPLKYHNGIYSMDLEDLESKINRSTRMLILSNPHNPTGNVWSPEILRSLAEICMKHHVLIISDEIHADLLYPGNVHTSMAGLSDDIAAATITCMSPSKTFNLAGLSTAFLIIPDPELRKRYNSILDKVHVGAGNIFGFVAAEAAYTNGDAWLEQLIRYLQGNLDILQQFVSAHIPQIKVIPPQATYLVWLDCNSFGMSASDLQNFMIHDAGVGMNAGIQFGAEGAGFLRMNIGCPGKILQQALKQIKTATDKKIDK